MNQFVTIGLGELEATKRGTRGTMPSPTIRGLGFLVLDGLGHCGGEIGMFALLPPHKRMQAWGMWWAPSAPSHHCEPQGAHAIMAVTWPITMLSVPVPGCNAHGAKGCLTGTSVSNIPARVPVYCSPALPSVVWWCVAHGVGPCWHNIGWSFFAHPLLYQHCAALTVPHSLPYGACKSTLVMLPFLGILLVVILCDACIPNKKIAQGWVAACCSILHLTKKDEWASIK